MPKDQQSTIELTAGFTQTEVDGVVTLKYDDAAAFKNGTDIDAATLKAVATYGQQYVKATTTLAANEAQKLMEGNKDVSKVIVQFPYTVSSNGNLDVTVNRSKTYPGMNGAPDVTKSTINVAVKDPYAKIKSTVKDLEKELTAALLG